MLPHTVYPLILRFPERPFSGLVGKADSPPIYFTPEFWRVWNLPMFFLQDVFHHLGCWKMILCGCTTEVYGRVARGGYGKPPIGKSGGGRRRADRVKKNGVAT